MKESIIDIPKGTPSAKAKTKDNQTVIIEIKLCGNMDFVKRIFYYISKNVINEVKEGENYNNFQKIISINLLDFNLKFGDEGKAHRCFKLIDTKDLNISLDLIQIHILEVKKFIEIIKNSTKEELKKLDFKVLDSKSNFLFISHNKVFAEDIYLKLKEKGILVRYFKQDIIKNFIRVTIGTDEEMAIFIKVLKEII